MTKWYPFREKGKIYDELACVEKITVSERGPYSAWEGCPNWCMSLAESCNPKDKSSVYDDISWGVFWKKMAWFGLFLTLFLLAVKYIVYVATLV